MNVKECKVKARGTVRTRKAPGSKGKAVVKVSRDAVRPRKSTQEQARKILYAVADMLSYLSSRESIVQYCAEKHGLQERQADVYIARARAYLREGVERTALDHRAAAVHRMQRFLEDVQIPDLHSKPNRALEFQVHKEINRLLVPAYSSAPAPSFELEKIGGEGVVPVDTLIGYLKVLSCDPATMIAAVESGESEKLEEDFSRLLQSQKTSNTLLWIAFEERLEKIRRGFSGDTDTSDP